MTAALRRRLAAVEETAKRRQARRYADEFGVDAGELLTGARRLYAEYQYLRLRGLSAQEAGQRVREQVAASIGRTLDDFDVEARRVAAEQVSRPNGR